MSKSILGRVISLVFMAIIPAILLTGTGLLIWLTVRQSHSSGFPTTTGVVLSSKVTITDSDNKYSSHHASIVYEYHVEGRTYRNATLRFGLTPGSASWANSTVQAHPVGSEITIYYDPANPAVALLFPGLQGIDFILFFIIAPILAMAIAGLFGAISKTAIFKKPNQPAGGVRIISQGLKTRARLAGVSSPWTILAFLLSSTVMYPLLLAISDGNPSLPEVWWCAAAALGTPGIVYGWHQLRVRSGIYDLVLDEHALSVTLPIGFGRKRPLRLNFDAVNSVSVEMIVTRKKRSRWVVMVSVQDGVARKEKLISWSAKEKADAFAVWLRERLHLTETAPQPAA